MMRAVLFVRTTLIACWFQLTLRPRAHIVSVLGALALLIAAFLFLIPPGGFPKNTIVHVEEGQSFASLAFSLEKDGIVRSAFALRVLARLTSTDDTANAGRYLFEKPVGSVWVLYRLATGDHGIPTVRVTFPEGTSVREMGTILEKHIADIDLTAWQSMAAMNEGYLFPDTYNFYKDATIEEIIERMRENFDRRTSVLQEQASARGVSFHDIVTMASLIEKEANTDDDRHIVSGILWSRIEEGVALQVDAVFPYIRQNPDHVPNGDDPELVSPYNTYLHRGLPPGPIANPGLEALDSALHPAATEYFYYLTGNDGTMYYAESFEGHKKNREQYLD